MNTEEILIRQLKLQNDLQEENNKLLREILRVLIKKQVFLVKFINSDKKFNYYQFTIEKYIFSVCLNYLVGNLGKVILYISK